MKIRNLILLLTFTVGLFLFFRYTSASKNKYELGTVQKRDIVEIVSESGSITSTGKANVYSTTNGIVENVFVSNGDSVKEKQKLFTVKSTASPQEKSEAFAAYQAAKSGLQQAENNRRSTMATVERVHDDVKDHDNDETFVQKELRTAAEVANDNAYDSLLIAQAQLSAAQLNYFATQNSTITAPISGSISNLSIIPGSSVSTNSPLTPTNPSLIISRLGATEIMVTVGESNINKINEGQKASIKFDAVEDKVYTGIVERLDDSGQVTQGVSKFNVYVVILDPDEQLKSGMNCDVDIQTKDLKGVLAVPNSAIKPYQKGRAVRLVGKKGDIEYLPIKTGIKGKDYTQILEGLELGQEIILSLESEKPNKASLFQI